MHANHDRKTIFFLKLKLKRLIRGTVFFNFFIGMETLARLLVA